MWVVRCRPGGGGRGGGGGGGGGGGLTGFACKHLSLLGFRTEGHVVECDLES